jgi:GT2 family glycosyltransferase
MTGIRKLKTSSVKHKLKALTYRIFRKKGKSRTERLPSYVQLGPRIGACGIDRLLHTIDGHVVVVGWCYGHTPESIQLRLEDAEGTLHDLYPFAASITRPDVFKYLTELGYTPAIDRLGFVSIIKTPTRLTTVKLTFSCGPLHCEMKANEVIYVDGKHSAVEVLKFASEINLKSLFEKFAAVVDDLRIDIVKNDPQPRSIEFGSLHFDPLVSIVVPLYGRIDLMEHQLAHFASDSSLSLVEIIYVLDDPVFKDELERKARFWHALYRVPFRLVILACNLGYSGANNVGVSFARAPKILLLNSDVLPVTRGWIHPLIVALDTLPDAGIVSPRLLFPDGTLQYGGISFRRIPYVSDYYLNQHPGKGLPPQEIYDPYKIDAATGACLMISKSLYLSVGGLDESFIMGDFEDSDLSLKVLTAGRTVWCVPGIALWHLERQSIGTIKQKAVRQYVTLYNARRQHLRWADVIERTQASISA